MDAKKRFDGTHSNHVALVIIFYFKKYVKVKRKEEDEDGVTMKINNFTLRNEEKEKYQEKNEIFWPKWT